MKPSGVVTSKNRFSCIPRIHVLGLRPSIDYEKGPTENVEQNSKNTTTFSMKLLITTNNQRGAVHVFTNACQSRFTLRILRRGIFQSVRSGRTRLWIMPAGKKIRLKRLRSEGDFYWKDLFYLPRGKPLILWIVGLMLRCHWGLLYPFSHHNSNSVATTSESLQPKLLSARLSCLSWPHRKTDSVFCLQHRPAV